jgi:Methyltransferase domain
MNREWTWKPESFDMVHGRSLLGLVDDWSLLCRRAFRCLIPGGYLEFVEKGFLFTSMKGPPDSIWTSVNKEIQQLGRLMNRSFYIPDYAALMKQAGFDKVSKIRRTISVEERLDIVLDQIECLMLRKWYLESRPYLDTMSSISELREELRNNAAGIVIE